MANDIIKKLVTFGDLSQLVENLKAKFVNQTCLNDYVKKSTYLNNIFKKGTVWFTYDKTNPSTFLGGTWALISEGYYPVATAKEIIDEQNERYVDAELPNVKASVIVPKRKSSSSSQTYDVLVSAEGAFKVEDAPNDSPLQYITNAQNTARQKLSVDLSKSNATYKDNGKVQPKSVLLYMWVRTDEGIIADDFQALTFDNTYFDVSQNKEITFKPTTSITSSSTNTDIPSSLAVWNTMFTTTRLYYNNMSSLDDIFTALNVPYNSMKMGYIVNLTPAQTAGASKAAGYIKAFSAGNDGNFKMIEFYPWDNGVKWWIVKTNGTWGSWQHSQTIITDAPDSGEIIQTIRASFNPNIKYPNTTWRKFKDGIYFSSGSTFEHRNEQLPNIKGGAEMYCKTGSNAPADSALYFENQTSNNPTAQSSTGYGKISIDASRNNSVYTDNGKVRPNTITTYSWIRVDGLTQEEMTTLEDYLEAV